MTEDEWREVLSDPENWPDGANLSDEWKLSYWVTKEVYTDNSKLSDDLKEKGANGLFHDVLAELGYAITENPPGTKVISLSSQEEIHSVRRIARFLLECENEGKSPQQLSSDLKDLGYQAR